MITKNKRLLREIQKLVPGEYSFTDDNNLQIILYNNQKEFLLELKFPKDYPFKFPSVYIKKKNKEDKEFIRSFLNFKRYNQSFIKNKLNTDWCPCCDTVMCNWSPGNTIHDIIYEFLNYENIKNIIINTYILYRDKLFFEDIFNKIISYNNISDIY